MDTAGAGVEGNPVELGWLVCHTDPVRDTDPIRDTDSIREAAASMGCGSHTHNSFLSMWLQFVNLLNTS